LETQISFCSAYKDELCNGTKRIQTAEQKGSGWRAGITVHQPGIIFVKMKDLRLLRTMPHWRDALEAFLGEYPDG